MFYLSSFSVFFKNYAENQHNPVAVFGDCGVGRGRPKQGLTACLRGLAMVCFVHMGSMFVVTVGSRVNLANEGE